MRCLLNLIFSDCEVCPTYCLLHFLHCIKYTMYGVSRLDLPCVLYVLVVLLLICEEWRSLSCRGQYSSVHWVMDPRSANLGTWCVRLANLVTCV